MNLRVRLAIVFTLLVGCTFVVVGTATYKLLRHGLLTEIERDVARRASVFARSQPSPPYALDVFAAPDVFLEVVTAAGKPLAGSGNLGRRMLPLPPAARAGRVVEARVGGRPLYLTAAPLGSDRFIIVARSPSTIYAALRELRNLLIVVTGAALIVTAALGAFFARTLDRSNQRMRQFLADCAHELRAPLTLMLSTLDVLARIGPTDPEFRAHALADVRDEATRMARMITQLLILARADAGTPMSAEPVALGDVLAEACRQARRMAKEMHFDAPAADVLDGVTVRGNADYLKQLMLILVDNAIKYTAPGGNVSVNARVTHSSVRITVADTGTGIDPDDLPRVFDRFYRGRNARGTTGTGLGLAIARWVAEQHGGTLEVESAPGRGARFSVVLPVLLRIP
jgi:two-component system, OmpR family, sensor kinase